MWMNDNIHTKNTCRREDTRDQDDINIFLIEGKDCKLIFYSFSYMYAIMIVEFLLGSRESVNCCERMIRSAGFKMVSFQNSS